MLLVIADDDRDAAETLGDLVRLSVSPPLEIVLAFDGRQAVEAATGQHAPDVVIMDIEMPRLNGVDAARAIRSRLGSRAPTLIAVTGHVGIIEAVAASGIFDHSMRKRVDVDALLGLLRSV